MATRIKEWMIPYTWWVGIEITENHVINVLLRALNNLIHVNEDNELYVDLQLDDGIQPDDDFPVGVTTWKILAEDWWQQNGIILNWKTTSWDYCRLIYANDWNLYYDPWTWDRIMIGAAEGIDINTKTFYLDNNTLVEAQKAYDWLRSGKNAIIFFNDLIYFYEEDNSTPMIISYKSAHTWVATMLNDGYSYAYAKMLYIHYNQDWEVTQVSVWEADTAPHVIAVDADYHTVYTPTDDGDAVNKKYVDDLLSWKQDTLTAGNNITITNNVISANLTNVYTYKGWVATYTDLANIQNPSVWDVWLAQDTWISYAWNWSQWISMWGSVNLTNYFNKVQDTSDDITQWTYNLFVTAAEKAAWSAKQDALTAWSWITIDANNIISAVPYTAGNSINITGHVVTNTAPFTPENTWTLSQVLRKTSTGYQWSNETVGVTSVNGQTWAVTVDEFQPSNSWSQGQVLKKTSTGYAWQNDSWWGWGGWSYTAGYWINIDTNDEISNTKAFDPSNSGSTGQVLTKTSSGYNWQTAAAWWVTSVNWQTGAVTIDEFDPTNAWTNGQVLTKTSNGYAWMNSSSYVKCFMLHSTAVTSSELKDIVDWINTGYGYWAILRITNVDDVCVYSETETSGNTTQYKFLSSRVHIGTTNWQQWDWTTLYNNLFVITVTGNTYTSAYQNWSTQANFLLCQQAQDYTNAYMPTSDWQPATKKYVDQAVQSATGGGITNDTVWTSTSVTKIRAGTQAQYEALSSYSNSTIYYVF